MHTFKRFVLFESFYFLAVFHINREINFPHNWVGRRAGPTEGVSRPPLLFNKIPKHISGKIRQNSENWNKLRETYIVSCLTRFRDHVCSNFTAEIRILTEINAFLFVGL